MTVVVEELDLEKATSDSRNFVHLWTHANDTQWLCGLPVTLPHDHLWPCKSVTWDGHTRCPWCGRPVCPDCIYQAKTMRDVVWRAGQ